MHLQNSLITTVSSMCANLLQGLWGILLISCSSGRRWSISSKLLWPPSFTAPLSLYLGTVGTWTLHLSILSIIFFRFLSFMPSERPDRCRKKNDVILQLGLGTGANNSKNDTHSVTRRGCLMGTGVLWRANRRTKRDEGHASNKQGCCITHNTTLRQLYKTHS